MLNLLLERIKGYSQITKEFSSEKEIFEKILERFAKETNSALVFVNTKCNFVYEYKPEGFISLDNKLNDNASSIDIQLNEQLKNIVEIKNGLNSEQLYIKTANKDEANKFTFAVSPVSAMTNRIGSIILYKTNGVYSTEEILLLEYITALVAITYTHFKSEESADEIRKIEIVKSAIGTLSYSELEAILHIFDELNGEEGLLVASKIADKVGITRSVIVNGLRKFESAGVIESRSLGMKGTYIRVLNDYLTPELKKLKK